MEDYEVKCYLKAGEAASKALKETCSLVHEGVPVKELCEKAEAVIRSLGAQPAFPCNVSIDSVAAHYTALADDEAVVPKGSLVKIDVGAHVDGYIGDVAATVSLSEAWEPLLEAAKVALKSALDIVKPGVSMVRLGGAIEGAIKAYGFKPIRNLTGHGLSRFNLHSGISVPNVKTGEGVIEDGAAYAIEPFATNGAGYVVNSETTVIYRYVGGKKVKDKAAKELLEEVWRRFNGLPFTERWLVDKYPLSELRKLVKLLVDARALYCYPVLVEGRGGMVSQFECTVILVEGECIVTTPQEWIKT